MLRQTRFWESSRVDWESGTFRSCSLFQDHSIVLHSRNSPCLVVPEMRWETIWRAPCRCHEESNNPQPEHTILLSTTNSNSGTLLTLPNFKSPVGAVSNKTMTGLHSQTFTDLQSRQPCLFQSKSRTSTFIFMTVAFTIHILGPLFRHVVLHLVPDQVQGLLVLPLLQKVGYQRR